MTIARVIFHKCVQDSQEYGSDDEHMVSRVFFTLEVDSQCHEGMYADLKQTVRSHYENGPIEVGPPQGACYKGPFNQEAFRKEAEAYYRSLVGSQGNGIRPGESARKVRMYHNIFQQQRWVEFAVFGSHAAW